MLGVGSGLSVAPRGGEAAVYRQRSVARETVAAGSRQASSRALDELLNRQSVAMEPKGIYGLGLGSRDESVSGIEELMAHLERKYKLTEM